MEAKLPKISKLEQCIKKTTFSPTVSLLKSTGSFHTSSCMRRGVSLTEVFFKWPCLVHITYLRVCIAMHCVCQKQYSIHVAQTDKMLNNKLSDLEVLFQLQPSQICFATSPLLTLRFSDQTGGFNVFPFVSAFPIEALHHLNLCLTTLFSLILSRHRCGLWFNISKGLHQILFIAYTCPQLTAVQPSRKYLLTYHFAALKE